MSLPALAVDAERPPEPVGDADFPEPQARPRRRWLTALLVAGLGGLVAIDRSPLAALVLLIVVVVPFEKLFPRHRQRLRRPGLGTDLAYALSQPVLRLATAGAGIVVGVGSSGLASGATLPAAGGSAPVCGEDGAGHCPV